MLADGTPQKDLLDAHPKPIVVVDDVDVRMVVVARPHPGAFWPGPQNERQNYSGGVPLTRLIQLPSKRPISSISRAPCSYWTELSSFTFGSAQSRV